MTQEEKAKAYDRVSKEVKDFFEGRQKMYNDVSKTLEYLFPELAESEDERTRKELMDFVVANTICKDGRREKYLAWLEKQGETFTKKDVDDAWLQGMCDTKREIEKQDIPKDYRSIDPYFLKPIDIDTINPKFKVGDWIFSPAWGTAHIIGTGVIGVNDSDFLLEYIDGKKEYTPSEYVNSAFDKWNIKDAKDGDVLVAKGNYFQEYIFIYSKMTEDDVISTHCGYDVIRNASDKTMSRFGRVEDFHFVCPATKEQRDLLFQKMREEGYEWDDNNKELKKFENL